MKKLFAIAALVAAMFTVNATEANAQSHLNWNDTKAVNHRIHEVHVKDYLQKGDDEFRLGHYEAAMKAYKSAREHNNIDENIVPNRVIDQKMDRCADAMRRERERNNNTWRSSSDNTWRNAPARPVSYNTSNDLVDVRSNGMSYTTLAANRNCRVLNVKSEFNYTVVEMEYVNNGRNCDRITIDRDTYLKDRNTGVRYSLRDTDGIGVNNSVVVYPGDSQIFRLYFNRVGGGCRSVDIVEQGSSSWKFYNVPMRM